jgi:hypothetical protein
VRQVDVHGDLQPAGPTAERRGEDPVVGAPDGDLGGVGPAGGRGGGQAPCDVGDRERNRPPAEHGDGAVGGDPAPDQQLEAPGGVLVAAVGARRAAVVVTGRGRGRREHAGLVLGERGGRGGERGVVRLGDPLGGGVVAQHPDQTGDDRADQRERQREPGPQAHGRRTV